MEEDMAQLSEAFGFLSHERDDVRKMAVHGIAMQSKDNAALNEFLARGGKDGAKAVDALLQFMHAGGTAILGDVLTILVNVCVDGRCAERLVDAKVVRKSMRLLDGIERSDHPDAYVRGIQELTLMLLSNLTASHISAVDDLLQTHDEDMRGFYLGKLQLMYSRLTPSEDDDAGEEEEEKKRGGRDIRKWILHILLNLTRSVDGQELLLEDEEWRTTLCDHGLQSTEAPHRLIAAQCYRNCSRAQNPRFDLLLKGAALESSVARLTSPKREAVAEIQLCLAEFIASMLESEAGMARLESINAKQALHRAVNEQSSRVEVVEEDGQDVSAAAPLSSEVCEFIERHIMPYLDDVVDAYLPPGCEELD